MEDPERHWADDIIADGFPPEAHDASDPAHTELVAVEAGPRRRIKIGEAEIGGKMHPVYEFAATEKGIMFNGANGEYEYVDAGKLDKKSNERTHRDQQPTQPLGAGSEIDLAFTANTQAAGTTRRRRVRADRIGDKTIG